MMDRVYNVLNLGAGVQSSRILLGACKGELPKFDVALFADTKWEPEGVYRTVEFLKQEASRAGIPVVIVSRGDLRADAIEFRGARRRSADGKRSASIPLFTKNHDGSQGRIRRQCTSEYKIEVLESWIRRQLLGLSPGSRVPSGVTVRQWFGISDNEASRAFFPGRFKGFEQLLLHDLCGEPVYVKKKRWLGRKGWQYVYPLLNEIWLPDRSIVEYRYVPRRENRDDCLGWLKKHFPDRKFPRSACIGCPFRSNEEWRDMRDNRPQEWQDACDFDDAQRVADAQGQSARKLLVGQTYLHRQLVPLRMADLGGYGEEQGAGCGSLHDGLDGLCDV